MTPPSPDQAAQPSRPDTPGQPSQPSPGADVVQPFNIHRLVEVFEDFDAEYALIAKDVDAADDTAEAADAAEAASPNLVLQSGIPHIVVHFDLEDDTLSAFATWEGRLPTSAEEELTDVIGELNWQLVAPTLSFSAQQPHKGPEELVICANRAMGVSEGLSQSQLREFVLSAFDSFDAAFAAVAQAFPKAAPWEENYG